MFRFKYSILLILILSTHFTYFGKVLEDNCVRPDIEKSYMMMYEQQLDDQDAEENEEAEIIREAIMAAKEKKRAEIAQKRYMRALALTKFQEQSGNTRKNSSQIDQNDSLGSTCFNFGVVALVFLCQWISYNMDEHR